MAFLEKFITFIKFISLTNRESFTSFKLIITKYDKNLLQCVTGIIKWGKTKYYRYYNVWQEVVKKSDNYYQVRHNAVSANLCLNLYYRTLLKPSYKLSRSLITYE